jgi:hypothetical protein
MSVEVLESNLRFDIVTELAETEERLYLHIYWVYDSSP